MIYGTERYSVITSATRNIGNDPRRGGNRAPFNDHAFTLRHPRTRSASNTRVSRITLTLYTWQGCPLINNRSWQPRFFRLSRPSPPADHWRWNIFETRYTIALCAPAKHSPMCRLPTPRCCSSTCCFNDRSGYSSRKLNLREHSLSGWIGDFKGHEFSLSVCVPIWRDF